LISLRKAAIEDKFKSLYQTQYANSGAALKADIQVTTIKGSSKCLTDAPTFKRQDVHNLRTKSSGNIG